MKKIVTGLFLFALISIQAQNVSDYKYVIVPQKFSDFSKEDYQLNSGLKIALRKKNYEIVNEKSIPLELQVNPCLATKANIENTSTGFLNRIKITFSDCNNHEINSYEGVSKIKDFAKGYQEALTYAMNQVNNQNAKDLPLTKSDQIISSSNKEEKPKEIISKSITPSVNSTVYKLNGKSYVAAFTTHTDFVLIDQEHSKVIAQFYPTSQQNVYHVTVVSDNGNYQTIGFLNGNNILIEYKTGDKSWSTTTYSK